MLTNTPSVNLRHPSESVIEELEGDPLTPPRSLGFPRRETWYEKPGPIPSLSLDNEATVVKIRPPAQLVGFWARRFDFMSRLLQYSGPGIMISVGYMDPGNWSTGLRAGAGWGYSHLFIVFSSSLIGMFLQTLAIRLGVAGKRDLAQACRDTYPHWINVFLWMSAELAMIATDLAEVIGFSIAFKLLTGLPTWAGVVLSVGDTLLLFLLPVGGGRTRAIEIISFILILVIAISFITQLSFARPPIESVFKGFVPSSTLLRGEATLVAVGILGATVMPHNLYLHGALVRLRGYALETELPQVEGQGSTNSASTGDLGQGAVLEMVEPPGLTPGVPESLLDTDDFNVESASSSAANQPFQATTTSDNESVSAATVGMIDKDVQGMKESLELGIWDNILSLSGAFAINSAIVILAASSFHPGVESGSTDLDDASSLSGAYVLLEPALGKASSVLFAVALLCSGQSSTFTGTMAGQVVMEGFLNIKLVPMVRRILTRTIAIVPAAIAVVAAGDAGLDRLLVLSQVTLSFQLPFAVIPLVYFCSCKWALGPFAISWFTSIVGWAICCFILFLNGYMVFTITTSQ